MVIRPCSSYGRVLSALVLLALAGCRLRIPPAVSVEPLSEDRQGLLEIAGATVTALRLFEQLPEHPIATMRSVTRLLSISEPSAGKAIEVPIKADILAEVGERKRDRLCRYESYWGLLV